LRLPLVAMTTDNDTRTCDRVAPELDLKVPEVYSERSARVIGLLELKGVIVYKKI